MITLLPEGERPPWFSYPPEYLRIVEQDLRDLTPWHLVDVDELRLRTKGLRSRSHRDLFPFAVRQENDIVACWERGRGHAIVLIDDFDGDCAMLEEFPDFWAWFRQAIEDMIGFDY